MAAEALKSAANEAVNQSSLKLGYWASLTGFLAAAGYSVIQILQVLKVVGWPWDDPIACLAA
jgi:hypothetical protein